MNACPCSKGELEESMAELEESRRRLVNLKMQKDAASGVHSLVSGAVNGSLSPEKHADKSMGLRELKDSIEETKVCIFISQLFRFLTLTHKYTYPCTVANTIHISLMQILAADRFAELQDAREDNLILSKQLQVLQVICFFILFYFLGTL